MQLLEKNLTLDFKCAVFCALPNVRSQESH